MKFVKVQEETIKTRISKQETIVNLNNTGYWLSTNPLYLCIAVQLELDRNKTYKTIRALFRSDSLMSNHSCLSCCSGMIDRSCVLTTTQEELRNIANWLFQPVSYCAGGMPAP
jgi:hypothetical protein